MRKFNVSIAPNKAWLTVGRTYTTKGARVRSAVARALDQYEQDSGIRSNYDLVIRIQEVRP